MQNGAESSLGMSLPTRGETCMGTRTHRVHMDVMSLDTQEAERYMPVLPFDKRAT